MNEGGSGRSTPGKAGRIQQARSILVRKAELSSSGEAKNGQIINGLVTGASGFLGTTFAANERIKVTQ